MKVQGSGSAEDRRHELLPKVKDFFILRDLACTVSGGDLHREETNAKSRQHLRLWYRKDQGSETPRGAERG